MSAGDDASVKRAREEDDDEEDIGPAPPPAGGAGDEEEEEDVGPALPPAKKKKTLAFEQVYLDSLPSGEMYEKSYMHRDWVTHLVVTASDFVVTASRDGQLKFWKKMQTGIEFIKHFRAHLAPFAGVAASADGGLLATTAHDRGLKVFDVLSFDMINWLKLDFTPGVCEWATGGGASRAVLAVADADSPEARDAAEMQPRCSRDVAEM